MAKWISEIDVKVQDYMIAEILKYQPECRCFDGDLIERVATKGTAKCDYYIQPLDVPEFQVGSDIKPEDRLHLIELRSREYKRFDFVTVYLNLDKWKYGQRIAKENGTKFIFCVQWEDGEVFASDETNARIVHDVSMIDLNVETDVRFLSMGGRNQMRDDNDVDKVVVNIPVKHFIPVSEFPRIIG